MNFNKCERCGCFFTSSNCVCPNCTPKDHLEIAKLENYLSQNKDTSSLSDICMKTGISAKNLNRYLQSEQFTGMLGAKGSSVKGNISINL